METVVKNLVDPSWWFTAIVAGLIVGVLGAFIKDWLARILATRGERSRKRRRTELRMLALRIRAFRRNIHLYYGLGWDVQFGMFMGAFVFTYGAALGPLNEFYTSHQEYDLVGSSIAPVMIGLLSLCAIVAGAMSTFVVARSMFLLDRVRSEEARAEGLDRHSRVKKTKRA